MKKDENIIELGEYKIYSSEKDSVYVCDFCGKSGSGKAIMFQKSSFNIKAYHKQCAEIKQKDLEKDLGIVKDNISNSNFTAPVSDYQKNETELKEKFNLVDSDNQKEKPIGRVLYKDKKIILLHPFHKEVIEVYHRFGVKYQNDRWEVNISKSDPDTCKFLLSINKKLTMFNWKIGQSALAIISSRVKNAMEEEKKLFSKLDDLKDKETKPVDTKDFLKVKPFPYQQKGIEFLNKINGLGMIGDEMGLGKSFQSLAYAEQHKFKTIIVCPATLKYNWFNEITKFTEAEAFVLTELEDAPIYIIQTINLVVKYLKSKETFEKKHYKRFDAAIEKAIKECESQLENGIKKNHNFNKLISFINLHKLPKTKENQIASFLSNQEKSKPFVDYVKKISKDNEVLVENIKNNFSSENFYSLNQQIKKGLMDVYKYFNDLFFISSLKKHKRKIVQETLKELKQFTIVNFEQLEKYEEVLSKAKFDLAIVDESQYIKNSKSIRTKKVMSLFGKVPKRILLSGTAIKNRPIELFTQLKFLYPKVFSQKHKFAMRYCDAKKDHFSWNYDGASNLKELYERISPFYLRRLKKDVLKELPPKIITRLELEMTEQDTQSYTKIIKDHEDKFKDIEQKSDYQADELGLLMKLRQHTSISKVKKIVELTDDILSNNEDKKIIIFSQFKATQQALFEEIKKNHMVASLFSDYSDKKRQAEVDRFQNDPYIRVFVSSLGAGGVGITLTEADTVIFADLAWSPSDHKQAEDRAHRLGQEDSVFVYYMTYKETIEEIMWKQIGKKLEIISQALDGDLDRSQGEVMKKVFQQLKKELKSK